MTGLVFEPEAHTYHLDGVRLPSVSEIIAGLGLARDWSFLKDRDFYLARGRAVHACVQFHFMGQEIDWSFEGAEIVRPRFDKFLRVAREGNLRPILCEAPMASPIFRFAGTVDYLGAFGPYLLAFADWKGDDQEPENELQVDGGYRGLAIEAARRGELGDITPADLMVCPSFIVPLGGSKGPIRLPDTDGANVGLFRGMAAAYNWKLSKFGDPK